MLAALEKPDEQVSRHSQQSSDHAKLPPRTEMRIRSPCESPLILKPLIKSPLIPLRIELNFFKIISFNYKYFNPSKI